MYSLVRSFKEDSMDIKDSDSIIMLAASNLVTMRPPSQGLKKEDLVKATVEIYKMLKDELAKS